MEMERCQHITDAEYELGRYKKKVADMQKQMDEMQEDAIAFQQINDINAALIASLLRRFGADKESPVKVSREEITYAIEHYVVICRPTETNDGYMMEYRDRESAV